MPKSGLKNFNITPDSHERLKMDALKNKITMQDYFGRLVQADQIITKLSSSDYRINIVQPKDRDESMMTLAIVKGLITQVNPGVAGFMLRYATRDELV